MLGQTEPVIVPETMPDFFGSPFEPEVIEESATPGWGIVAALVVGGFLLLKFAGKKGI